MDRVLRIPAVVVPWLKRNDCQQVMLSITGAMVVHVAFARAVAAHPEKSCGDGDLLCLAQGSQDGLWDHRTCSALGLAH